MFLSETSTRCFVSFARFWAAPAMLSFVHLPFRGGWAVFLSATSTLLFCKALGGTRYAQLCFPVSGNWPFQLYLFYCIIFIGVCQGHSWPFFKILGSSLFLTSFDPFGIRDRVPFGDFNLDFLILSYLSSFVKRFLTIFLIFYQLFKDQFRVSFVARYASIIHRSAKKSIGKQPFLIFY